MSLNPEDIRIIVDALEDSDWDQATITVGDTRISVARNGMPLEGQAPVAAAPAAVAPAAPVAATTAPGAPEAGATIGQGVAHTATAAAPAVDVPGGHVIESPSVGVFWRAPQPGAAAFVEVGSQVQAGDTIGIVEVMKLMNNIAADVSGEVVAVHVDNAGAVEFGTPLVTIRPEA